MNLSTIAWGMPGGGELIVIFVIILLLFGAKRLPELARALGQAKNEFGKAAREASDEITKVKEITPKDSNKSDASH
jgi:sec-independent protein translocase protein TatA